MSSDDPRIHRTEQTVDWPINPPPNARSSGDGEATTVLGGDANATQRVGAELPPPPLQPHQPWSAPSPATAPSGAGRHSAPGRAPHPGYAAQLSFPSHAGYLPPPAGSNSRPASHRKLYRMLAGEAAVVAIVIVVGAVVAAVLMTRSDGHITAGPATMRTAVPSSSATPSTTSSSTPPAPVSVDPARLPQMLLAADAIRTTLSASSVVPSDVRTSDDLANDSIIEPPNCTSTWGPGKTRTYQLSGVLGMARQVVAEQPTPHHGVVQAVLAFPDATAAKKSYDDQVKSWGDCQATTITSHVGGAAKDQTAVIGVATEIDGVATLPTTPDLGLPGVVCERALTTAGNVVVDVRSCSPDVGDTAGTIARDIAAKITNGR